MMFTEGQTVIRDRRAQITDPYSGQSAPGSWDAPLVITISGAFVASSSSADVSSATRTQVISAKSLYCEPGADVAVGDRIRASGRTYEVDAVPESDVNPFTGWQPVQEIPLTEVLG